MSIISHQLPILYSVFLDQMGNLNNNLTSDLIHMVHVLYHIDMDDLEDTLSYYFSILNPGGLMFITYESGHCFERFHSFRQLQIIFFWHTDPN